MTGGDKRQQFMSQITNATGVVYNQLGRLKLLDGKFASMETSFLEQIATNIKAGNNARAKIIATELINEFAAILDAIEPTIEMIKGIQTELTRAIPAANEVLSEVSTVTADVLLNANIKADARISTPMDTEALSILHEVEGTLEDEAKARLPDVPSSVPSQKLEDTPAEKTEVLVES